MTDWMVQRREGLVEAETGEEIFALHIEQGTCYGFNPTATQVWKLLDRPRRVSELCTMLAERFSVQPDVCAQDVRELLRDLERDGLIRIDDEA